MENYKAVDEKYGDGMGFIAPMDEYRLSIPVKDIVERLKISYEDYETVITQALRDKTVKPDENNDMEDCLVMAENTRLFYNEKTYLKRISLKENNPLLYDAILILLAALVSIITTIGVGEWQRKKDLSDQDKINLRQDSTINNLKNLLNSIQVKDTLKSVDSGN